MKWNNKFNYPKSSRSNEDGFRKYLFGDKKLPSVTSILSRTKSEEDKASLELWKKRVGYKEANRIKTEASSRGSSMHSYIEDYLKGKEVPEQVDKRVVNCWNIFIDWWPKQDYKPIEIEKKIYSKKHNYAGTLDLIVKDKEQNLVLIDIKTSNQVSFDYLLQLYLLN